MMGSRLCSLLLAALLLTACSLPSPLPVEEWDVPSDRLYPPAVWIETSNIRTGVGVIVASTPVLGMVVLTAHHVVRDAGRIRVGVFRHSRTDGSGPEYVRFPAEIVITGSIHNEWIAKPIRELAASYEALLEAADSPGRFPRFEAQLAAFRDAIHRIESARNSDEFVAGLDRIRQGLESYDDEFLKEFGEVMEVISERISPVEGTQLGQRVPAALETILDAITKFGMEIAVGYDAALLRIRTKIPHHSARCLFATAKELDGAAGRLVTIKPDRQPRVRAVTIREDVGLPGLSRLTGLLEPGNSGSPVFVDGQLIGIVTDGLFPMDEAPGDRSEEALFLRIRTVRDWLARRGLGGILH